MKTATKTKIAVRNLDMTFRRDGNSVSVLEGINLEAHEGEFVCLLGPSGCGKSTLLNIVAGFLKQTGGEVVIDGDAGNDTVKTRKAMVAAYAKG